MNSIGPTPEFVPRPVRWACPRSARLRPVTLFAFGAPSRDGPEKAAEVLEAEDDSEDCWDQIVPPQHRHDERHRWPIEQRCKDEALRIDAAAHGVERAEARDEQDYQPKIDCWGCGAEG